MSHGRLIHHQLTSSTNLAHVAIGDLGAELLTRLTQAASHGSRKDLERHLQLLTELYDATETLMDVPENRRSVANLASLFRFAHHCWKTRLFEFPAYFKRHGFEVLDHWLHNKIEITGEFRARLVEPWKSMPDQHLDTTHAQVLIRRL